MFKKAFWILIFLILTFTAYLAADLVIMHLKTFLDVPHTNHVSAPKKEMNDKRGKNRKQYYEIISQRDLFQIQPPKGEAKKTKELEEEEKVAPITQLKLKLLGTMIGRGIIPFAIILDQRSRKQDLYTEGDQIGPAQLIKIYRHKVILLHDGNEEMLLAFDQLDDSLDASLAVDDASSTDEQTEPAKLPTRVGKKIGTNHWVLARDEVQDVITNSSQLLTQVRIIPHFAKGKMDEPDGFQVANIKPRSFFDMMGLRNGDVIKSVNREPIDNPEKAFEAYQKFKQEPQIEVVVLRNNREMTLKYDIND
ncbi:MAG: type II secretion system protein GspC [bacterium]